MKLISVIVIFCFGLSLQAQQFNFIPYSVKDNLAQSQVTDICQDKDGYLWIGTESGGLSRFDGVDFVNFSMDDGLVDNKIEKLYIDSKQRLWVASSEGLSRYENRSFVPYYFEEPLRINDIVEFQEEIYLASNTGLVKFVDGRFERLVIDNDEDLYLRSIENYHDSLLICGSKIGVYTWNKSSFSPLQSESLYEKNILDVQVFRNTVYVSVHKEGIYSYSFSNKKESLLDLEFTRIRSFHIDERGLVGVTIGYGAFAVKNNRTDVFDESSGLLTNNLNCVFRDAENNIWIGTDGKGLLKFSGRSIVYYSTQDQLSSGQVMSINQLAGGRYIFGTYGAGITLMNQDESFSYLTQKTGLRDDYVWSLAVSGDSCWIGTTGGVNLLYKDQLIDHPFTPYKTKIRTIEILNDSTVLFGGDNGLFVLRGNTITNLHSEFNIYKLARMGNKVYCAGHNGLFEFEEGGDFTSYKQILLPENAVNSVVADHFGNLWAGTENGLFMIDPDKDIYPIVLDANEYNSKTVFGLIVNDRNEIWVSTMNGVYQIIPQDPEKFKIKILHYGIAEGLIDLECNGNALFEDDNHYIWVGTSSGLARIDPSLNDELFDVKPPALQMTGLRLFMEDFDYHNYKAEIDPRTGVPTSISLPYNKNHLTFDFIGINLKDPESVQYEYRLIGTNDSWSPLYETRYATYSFLQPGKYSFEVRATNKNHVWSDIQRVEVEILPPFWQTWWFYVLSAMTFLVIIVFIFQNRIRAIKQKQENEQLGFKNRLLFLEQQSLNASMNRHFIFNSLNSIQYFINSSDKVSANKYLSSFAKLIRKNLDSSSANNFIVTLQEEIDRIELYLSLEKMRFRNKFDYTIEMSPGLDTESIEIPSMILQPFVENSIIHGVLPVEKKGKILIKIYEEFGEVVFEVLDDGLGIDNSLKMKKDSVGGDHKSRGMDITNRRIELLRKITGENLLIIGPFQLNDEDGNCLGTKVIIKMSIEGEV